MWLPLFVYGKLLTLKMRKNALKIPTRLFEDAYLGQVSGSHLPPWASVSSSAELNGSDSKVTSGLKKSLLVLFLYGRISWVFIELDLELCCTSRSQYLTYREGIKRGKREIQLFSPLFSPYHGIPNQRAVWILSLLTEVCVWGEGRHEVNFLFCLLTPTPYPVFRPWGCQDQFYMMGFTVAPPSHLPTQEQSFTLHWQPGSDEGGLNSKSKILLWGLL